MYENGVMFGGFVCDFLGVLVISVAAIRLDTRVWR
jgi:hypothetical protein